MIYRILTEDKNRDKIEEIVNQYFEGYNIVELQGYWKGTKESAIAVEIDVLNEIGQYSKIVSIALLIKFANDQENVLVQVIDAKSELI